MLVLTVAGMVVALQQEALSAQPNTKPDVAYDWQDFEEPFRLDDLEVRGRRGAALVAPEVELNGAEIDALGAWDVSEVLSRLEETLGVGASPLVTINGKRVANAGVYYGFPPDALVRAEVLPVEATTLYGGEPGQRVVNLVMQRRFSSYDGRAVGSSPTQGGMSSVSGDMRRSGIIDESSHQLGLKVSRDTSLRVAERNREQVNEGREIGDVTLRPDVESMSVNAALSRSLGDWSGALSFNGHARDSRSVALMNGSITMSRRKDQSFGGSASINGNLVGGNLQANVHGQMSRGREDGFTGSRHENHMVGINASFNRNLLTIPAGPVIMNLGGNWTGSRTINDRSGTRTSLDFYAWDGRGTLTAPLLKADTATMSGRWIGDLRATFGTGLREMSGGKGKEFNAILDWVPKKYIRLNAVWSNSLEAVSDIQRYEPLYFDVTRTVFDFKNNESVEIVPILGGNPNLRAPSLDSFSLTANLGPATNWNFLGSVGYKRTDSRDGIGALPSLTEDIESAFPDRFGRDINGRLINIDYRPLNLTSSRSESLNSSFSFNIPRGDGVISGNFLVLRLSLGHSFRIKNSLKLLPGRPDLNRLNGDGGGVPDQDFRITLDARRAPWGLNATAQWQDGYRTRSMSGVDGPRDLIFEPLAVVNLKFSFQIVSSASTARDDESGEMRRRRSNGLQLLLEVENLFDARPEARLADGSEAHGYGRDYQDPIGRSVKVTLQRRF